MVRSAFLAILLLLQALLLPGQNPVGTWEDHLSFFSARNIAAGSSKVFASTGSGIIVFDKEYNELSKLTKVQGLTETSISCIAWSEENEALIVAYSTTNLDIIKKKSLHNIPDIKRKYIPGKKEIFRIKTMGRYAYLASSFGIVVLDIQKNEISDTWLPGTDGETNEVYDIDFYGEKIYAATGKGVFHADLSNPGLSFFGNWSLENRLPSPAGHYNAIAILQNRIYVNRYHKQAAGDSVFVISTSASLFSYQPGIFNLSFEKFQDGFIINTKQSVKIYSNEGILTRTISSYNPGNPDISHAMAEGDDIWIADISSGLVRGISMTTFEMLNLPGPYTSNVIYLTNSRGRTYIAGGAVDITWNNQWRPLQVFAHENNLWTSQYTYDLRDAMRILPDPNNNDHFWVTAWGAGLLEYENNSLVRTWDYTNSPLQTIIPGMPYVRVCGMALDADRNIWITQTGVEGSIKVLKTYKEPPEWITFPFRIEAPTIADIIITRSGDKWVLLPRGSGLFVLDDNHSPDDFSDDRSKQFLIRDIDNKIISNVFSLAEDLDGNIWIGTDQGPVIYYNPERIFDNDPRAFRVKVPRDDGTGLADYMLGTETITAIAVDGANRKWLGTSSSGVYLLSEDGTEQLVNYTEENSPLLSNNIVSVDVDDSSGEVWFGTSRGVISVRGDATMGGEKFGEVYTFPNPVRENYTGNVTITGLLRNTQIKITDISGNLVYRTISDGGQATWDLKTYNGEKVSTGVYLIFCASEDGSQATVAKMLVIK